MIVSWSNYRRAIDACLNDDELELLCLDLRVDFGHLEGKIKPWRIATQHLTISQSLLQNQTNNQKGEIVNMSNYDSRNTKLVPAICTQCGGSVEVVPSQEKALCKYCGTSFFVEKAMNNYNVQHANIEHVQAMNVHHNKRGAVEAILNFVEKQQDKKQERIDEEKRRLEL